MIFKGILQSIFGFETKSLMQENWKKRKWNLNKEYELRKPSSILYNLTL